MGKRITRVYTRTGDDGSTGMADGSRVSKASAVIEAIGVTDELNAHIGLLRSVVNDEAIDAELHRLQHQLFALGGELSMPEYQTINDDHAQMLEAAMDRMNETLSALEEFILPAGNMAVAQCHVARTVCRRLERQLVAMPEASVRAQVMAYVNRLSDYFFVLARYVAKFEGIAEVYWQQKNI